MMITKELSETPQCADIFIANMIHTHLQNMQQCD